MQDKRIKLLSEIIDQVSSVNIKISAFLGAKYI